FWFNALAGAALVLALWGATRRAPRDGPTATRGGRGIRHRLPTIVLAAGIATLVLALSAPPAPVRSGALGGPLVPFPGTSSALLTPIGVTALAITAVGLALTLRRAWPVLAHTDLPGALLLGGALGCTIITFATDNPQTEVIGPLGYTMLPVAAVLAILYVWRHHRAAEPLIPRGVLTARVPWTLIVSFLVGVALVAIVVAIPLLSRLTI